MQSMSLGNSRVDTFCQCGIDPTEKVSIRLSPENKIQVDLGCGFRGGVRVFGWARILVIDNTQKIMGMQDRQEP